MRYLVLTSDRRLHLVVAKAKSASFHEHDKCVRVAIASGNYTPEDGNPKVEYKPTDVEDWEVAD